jgi:hypothetical protein
MTIEWAGYVSIISIIWSNISLVLYCQAGSVRKRHARLLILNPPPLLPPLSGEVIFLGLKGEGSDALILKTPFLANFFKEERSSQFLKLFYNYTLKRKKTEQRLTCFILYFISREGALPVPTAQKLSKPVFQRDILTRKICEISV